MNASEILVFQIQQLFKQGTRQISNPFGKMLCQLSSTTASTTLHWVQAGRGNQSYLQVLPPDVDGRKGQLHLLPAGVFMALIGNLDEDEEDPCCYASSHQHEDPCWQRKRTNRQSRGGDMWAMTIQNCTASTEHGGLARQSGSVVAPSL